MATTPPSPQPLVDLQGMVDRITYQNAETGYTVARVQTEGGALVTVVGNLLGINPGESIVVRGSWSNHPEHGRQFRAENYRLLLPATVDGVRKYLGSGLIRGVGPVMARRIVDHFGVDALDVIDREPERLLGVPGVGAKRVEAIGKAWVEQRAIKEVMVLLESLGVGSGLAAKIYKAYGDNAVGVVRNQPYQLVRHVWGIGFKTADKIARGVGIRADAVERAEAGLLFTLSQAADDGGHVFLPRDELVQRATEVLEIGPSQVVAALEQMIGRREVTHEEVDGQDAVYLIPFHRAEVAVSTRLTRLLRWPEDRLPHFHEVNWAAAFGWLEGRGGVGLTERQAEAVRRALTDRVLILTGGPGTGKTITTRSVVQLAAAKRGRVALAAPTGRAAKRLAEATGFEAKTIHRLLGLAVGGRAEHDEQNPLEADLVVVDEVSMLDILLFNNLLKAVPPGAHLLLVGDADQLPAVGAGNVLADLLNSGVVPSVRLDVVFRQSETSAIVANAHRINAGELPHWGGPIADFYLFPAPTPEATADLVVDLVSRRIPRSFGILPAEVQVLSPMHRGAAGVGLLNERLQETLNPPAPGKAEVRLGGRLYRVGDRVVVHRNNYNLEVFNGDLGTVAAVDPVEHLVGVRFEDGRTVEIEYGQTDELGHAFAMSIHKAQGSEFRAVVVPVLTSHYVMLARNLLYTAVTRAKELVVLVGQVKAVAIAVKSERVTQRWTGLGWRLAKLLTD